MHEIEDAQPAGGLRIPTDEGWDQISSALYKAFVGIAVGIRLPEKLVEAGRERIQNKIFSGFLLEYRKRWYLVSAAHCIEMLDSAVEKGAQVLGITLLDNFTSDNPDLKNFPIPYDRDQWMCFDLVEQGVDLALLPLSEYAFNLLVSVGKCSVPSSMASGDDSGSDFYTLVGIPESSINAESERKGNQVTFSTGFCIPLLPIVPVSDEEANEADMLRPEVRFVGRIYPLAHRTIEGPVDLSSIVGMSGGPVFGCSFEGNDLRIKLEGVQSTWKAKKRLVAVSRIKPLIDYLDSVIADA